MNPLPKPENMRAQTSQGISLVLAMLYVRGREWSETFAKCVDEFVQDGKLPADSDHMDLIRALASVGMGMVCDEMDAMCGVGKALKQ